MFHKLLGAAVGALVLGGSAAGAVTFNIDNFNTAQGPVSDFVVDGAAVFAPTVNYSVGGNSFTRDLSIELVDFSGNIGDQAQVNSGIFDVNNSVAERTIAELTYVLPASLQADIDALDDVTSLAIFFTVVDIDLERVNFSASLNGNDLGAVIPAVAGPGIYRFNVPLGNVDGTFTLSVFSTPQGAGFDVAIDSLSLFVGQRGGGFQVPAPGSLALLGLGLASIAIARRR